MTRPRFTPEEFKSEFFFLINLMIYYYSHVNVNIELEKQKQQRILFVHYFVVVFRDLRCVKYYFLENHSSKYFSHFLTS